MKNETKKIIEMNKSITGINDNVRFNSKDLMEIDNIITNYSLNTDSFEEYLRKLLFISAYIWAYQPFYDGNSRTAKAFIIEELKKRNYSIDFDDIKIPIFYPEDENEILDAEILSLKKNITRM